LTLRELTLWTPDDRSIAEYLSIRANEAVGLGCWADVFDVSEHPGLNAELSSACYDGCQDLCPGGNFMHDVMTELEAWSPKCNSLPNMTCTRWIEMMIRAAESQLGVMWEQATSQH
jgi:hypothetical protein